MRAVLDAWDEHLTHVALPRTLTAELCSAGFEDVRMQAHAFATNELGPDSYGGFLVPFMEQFALDREAVAEDEVRAWGDEQRELAAHGEFYASVTQFLFTGTRPG
jgi:hypothetical protein